MRSTWPRLRKPAIVAGATDADRADSFPQAQNLLSTLNSSLFSALLLFVLLRITRHVHKRVDGRHVDEHLFKAHIRSSCSTSRCSFVTHKCFCGLMQAWPTACFTLAQCSAGYGREQSGQVSCNAIHRGDQACMVGFRGWSCKGPAALPTLDFTLTPTPNVASAYLRFAQGYG